MTLASLESFRPARTVARIPAWLVIGAFTALILGRGGSDLLNDSDTYWQIKVGEWILSNGRWPQVDMFSLTRIGEPWISSSWLSQVMFAKAWEHAGWSGVVLLAVVASAATFALLTRLLMRHFAPLPASIFALLALVLCMGHLLARPHVLALPVMLGWIGGLFAASDERRAPSFMLLPLMAIWPNLHGGFVLGLALIGPIALDALVQADAPARRPLLLRWILFGCASVLACGLTPYGFSALQASGRILNMGQLLKLISEWAPADFSSPSVFEAALLALAGGALVAGVKLPLTRVLFVLGLTHMALNHIRNIEVFALVLPLVLAAPLVRQFPELATGAVRSRLRLPELAIGSAVCLVIAIAAIATRPPRPGDEADYTASIAALRQAGATRIFNDYGFGGFMIWSGVPPFIDGRAELYGEAFTVDHYRATNLIDPDQFVKLLGRWDIDATLLYPETPAAKLLDHMHGWRRIFSNGHAVIHVRTDPDFNLRLKSQDGF